jgi:hypothetical protein
MQPPHSTVGLREEERLPVCEGDFFDRIHTPDSHGEASDIDEHAAKADVLEPGVFDVIEWQLDGDGIAAIDEVSVCELKPADVIRVFEGCAKSAAEARVGGKLNDASGAAKITTAVRDADFFGQAEDVRVAEADGKTEGGQDDSS